LTFKEQEQFTKKNSDDLHTELSNYHGENLISEIVRLGMKNYSFTLYPRELFCTIWFCWLFSIFKKKFPFINDETRL